MTNPGGTHFTLNDGNALPIIGFGVFLVSNNDVVASVTSALDVGYRLIDTASIYKNELGVGLAVKSSNIPRSQIYLTSKVWNDSHGGGKTRNSCMSSLQKLDVDFIDLLLIHWPCPSQNLFVEAWKEMIELREEGLVKSIGVSNFNVNHIEEIIAQTGVVPSVNQIECHPWLQQDSLRLFHDQHNIITQSWSPLGRGRLLSDATILDIASKHSISAAQVILSWHLALGALPIPKSTNPDRIRENFSLTNNILDEHDLSRIKLLDSDIRTGPNPLNFN